MNELTTTDRRYQVPSPSSRSVGIILILAGTVALGIPLLDREVISKPLVRSIVRSESANIKTVVPDDLSDQESPEVAWLMTYPNSGTTYTLKLIQEYTNTTTATNYGNEQSVHGTNVPVHPWMEQGPFIRYPTWNKPSRYILTKTHCGGTKMSPTPEDYVETVRSFEIACRSGNRVVNDTKVSVTYAVDVPKRAVHLIRNPFDNIVARLHLEQKRWERMEDRTEQLELFNATKDGFRAWCYAMDSRSIDQEARSRFIDEELWEIARNVPCHGELLRYTWWHNYAIELTRRMNIPVHVLFYEDYTDDWEKTVEQLLQFISLSPAPGARPYEFIAGKHYGEYFDPDNTAMAKLLVKALASPETWDFLKRYFK